MIDWVILNGYRKPKYNDLEIRITNKFESKWERNHDPLLSAECNIFTNVYECTLAVFLAFRVEGPLVDHKYQILSY